MSAEHRTKSAAGLSRLWDRGEFDRFRATDGRHKYDGRRLALHLLVQPVVAETVLSDPLLCGQGFLARTLLTWPDSRMGQRCYVEQDLGADPALVAYRRAANVLLDAEYPAREDSRNELEPRALPLAPDAKRQWVTLHNDIEKAMRPGAEYSSVRPWASKAPAQILRIAGVLTLIGDPHAGVVTADAIERGAALTAHALEEAVRLIGYAQVPSEVQHAQALLDWCHAERITQLHSGAALQYGPYVVRTKESFDTAVRRLERAGWAVPIEGGAEIDGKQRRRVWEVHP
jgi:hypothetical protein